MLFFFFLHLVQLQTRRPSLCCVGTGCVLSFWQHEEGRERNHENQKTSCDPGGNLSRFLFWSWLKYKYVNFTFLNYVSFLNRLVSCSHTGLSYNLSAIASAFCTLSCFVFFDKWGPESITDTSHFTWTIASIWYAVLSLILSPKSHLCWNMSITS